MKISTLLITIFMISIFTTGFIGFYGALMSENDLEAQAFNRANNTSTTLTTLETMYNITESSQNTTAVSSTTSTDAPYNLLTGAFNAVLQTLALPAFFSGLITDLTVPLGIPTWFTASVMGIVLVIIIAGLAKFFANRDW